MHSDNKIDSVLGQKVTYPQTYDPQVLVAVPRRLNREGLGIADDALPFVGCDSWHAYEASCLTAVGMPVVGLLKIVYPCCSRCIVESKSLKLYLNSFNMEPMGADACEAAEAMRARVEADLRSLLETDVRVRFFQCDAPTTPLPTHGFTLLEEMPEVCDTATNRYTEAPELLTARPEGGRMRLKSNLLRSNCRVTHQPDWGTVFIDMEGGRLPTLDGLLRYIVSLRGENHFHEEICELIYTRLMELFCPRQLMVACVYTRRGGIDICPQRASSATLLMQDLGNAEVLTGKLGRS